MNDMQKVGLFIADKVNRIGQLIDLTNAASGSGSGSGSGSYELPSNIMIGFTISAPYYSGSHALAHIGDGEGQTYNSFSASYNGNPVQIDSVSSTGNSSQKKYTVQIPRSALVDTITIRSSLSSHDVICTLDVSSVWSSWQQLEGVNINNTGDTFYVS